MAASYPKPDDERRNRTEPRFGWTDLPAAHAGKAPGLPALRTWSDETLRWWKALWSKPQAAMWDASGSTAVPMAVLYQDLQDVDPSRTAGLLAELRQHEDRHGLNPKAMLQLRWRIVEAEPKAQTRRSSRSKPAESRRERVLRMIPGDAS